MKDFGEPEDYSSKRLSCIYNISAMCCQRHVPDQNEIFDALQQNRMQRHASSIVHHIGIEDYRSLAEINKTADITGTFNSRSMSLDGGSSARSLDINFGGISQNNKVPK